MTAFLRWSPFPMPTFADRLKAARVAHNIAQNRLAELLNVDPRVYNRWEKGLSTPHFETVVKIADILQVSLDELAGRTELSAQVKIRNPKLHSLYQEMDTLSDDDQQALIILMDSLVKRSQMNRLLAK